MEWNNLKSNKCPECNADMAMATRVDTSNGPGLKCRKCNFTISDTKFESVVNDKIRKEFLYPDSEVTEEEFL